MRTINRQRTLGNMPKGKPGGRVLLVTIAYAILVVIDHSLSSHPYGTGMEGYVYFRRPKLRVTRMIPAASHHPCVAYQPGFAAWMHWACRVTKRFIFSRCDYTASTAREFDLRARTNNAAPHPRYITVHTCVRHTLISHLLIM